MSTNIIQASFFEVNPESSQSIIASAHQDANAIIDWLSIPGVGERYMLDVDYVISLLRILINSCTPEQAVGDIDLLIGYVKMAVGE